MTGFAGSLRAKPQGLNDIENLSWKRKALLGLAAALFILVLICILGALGEWALRAVAPRSDELKLGVTLNGSERRYGLRPNSRSTQVGVLVETNSLGFREREYPVERAAGVPRIAILGDSYTSGVGVAFNEIFAKQLEEKLTSARGKTEVINFGVPGYNTTLELATLREAVAPYRPDLVILGYVLNDTDLEVLSEAKGAHTKQPTLNALHLRLKDESMLYRYVAPQIGALAGLVKARYAVGGTKNIIGSFDDDAPGWVHSRRALVEIADEVRKMQARLLVVVFPMMLDFRTYPLQAAHDKVSALCTQHGIEVLDLLPRLRGENAAELAVFMDGHPNGRAHRIFADEIFAHLAPIRPSDDATAWTPASVSLAPPRTRRAE